MSKKTMTCPECGENATVTRGSWPFRDIGLKGVVLAGVEIIRCESCGGEMPIIPRVNDMMMALAQAVIRKPSRLTGEEVRFLRKHISATQQEFARRLQVDKTTVSKWENGDDPVGKRSDMLIRFWVLTQDPEIRPKIEKALDSFIEVKAEAKPVKIELNSETLDYQYA